jgi:elongation factor G
LLGEVPPDLKSIADEALDALGEAVAETDEALTEKFLEEGALTLDEIRKGLHEDVRTGVVVPVLVGSCVTGGGIPELLDAIVDYLPSPAELPPAKATKGDSEIELPADPNGPLAAIIFKTSADPFVGKLSYFKVVSGTIHSGDVYDVSANETERIAQVFVPIGKHQEPVPNLVAGDIGVVAKLAHTLTGHTLTTKADAIKLPGVEFPDPVYKVAVHPKSKADLEKLSTSLTRLVEEDPSLHLVRDHSTGELVVTGYGDTHIDVLAERAHRKFGVDLVLAVPKVPYRETVGKTAKAEYKHKKQSGGHGQYGHVVMRIEPMERGGGFQFASEVVGGNVPKEYVPAVEKGVHKTMEEGAVAGYPIVDVKVVLTDGSSHPVDSSGQSFEIAGSMALKAGMKDAMPMLLEPVMRVAITAPEHSAGTIVGDLNTRRAQILGMAPENGIATIEALMPQTEAQQYSIHLRALTQGRGAISMTFDHYGEVPQNLVHKIIEEHDAANAVKV